MTEPKTTQNKQKEIEMNPKPKPTNHKFKKYLRGCRAFCPVKTQSQVKCILRRTHRKQISHKRTITNPLKIITTNSPLFLSAKQSMIMIKGIATEA